MSIDKRLREDAARLTQVKPPADLRARLQASLDAVPPLNIPRTQRPVRKWFMPAVAMLALVMIVVLIPPLAYNTTATPEGVILTHGDSEPETQTDSAGEDYEAVRSADDLSTETPDLVRELPLGRIGIFVGLALVTGFLCLTELKGRPRLLIPALAALALFVTAGMVYILGIL